MCTISVEPKNKQNSKDRLRNMFDNNSHGTGFAYSNGSKIIVNKYLEFKPFYKEYLKAKKVYKNKSAFIIHSRIQTDGIKGLFNDDED